jgi:ABC-2 type transport system ATP-binding protein
VLIDTGRSLYQGPTRALLDGVVAGLAVVPQDHDDQALLQKLLVADGHRVDADDERLVVSVDHADVGALAASVNRQAFDAGIVLIELSPIRTTLEDRYLTMVSGGTR